MLKISRQKFLLVTSLLIAVVVTSCSGSTGLKNTTGLEQSSSGLTQLEYQDPTPMPSAYEMAVKALEEQGSPVNQLKTTDPAGAGNNKQGLSVTDSGSSGDDNQENPGDALYPDEVQSENGNPLEVLNNSQPPIAVDENIEIKPQVGYRAPDFELQTLDGQIVKLSDLRGVPVVISYWATWCVPCKEELPVLQQTAREFGNDRLQIITINAIEQDTVDQVAQMTIALGLNLPVLLDKGDVFHTTYQQLFFPTNYFIDSSGVIQEIKLGSTSEAELRLKIENLLNKQS